jgi:biotin carboxylase
MRLADEFVHVPGGSALKFNVELVVNIAQRCGVDAVWPVRLTARVQLTTLPDGTAH